MELMVPFLSDLIAGLVGAAFIAGFGLLLRFALQHLRPGEGRKLSRKVRLIAWPLLTVIFFACALTSAISRGTTGPSVVVLAVVLALVLTAVVLYRFGPESIRHQLGKVRAYGWPILTAVFFLSTITLLLFGTGRAPLGERIVFIVDLADEEMIVMRDILDELEPELGAEVFLMNVDRSRYVARLDRMVASDDMKWDLIAVDNSRTGLLAAKGLVEELSNYAEYDKLIPESLLPFIGPILKFEDIWYFAPFRPNVKIAFYNEPKFAQYGLRPPMTWEELLDVARIFYEKEGVGRVAIQGYPGPASVVTVFEFVKAFGGNPRTLDDNGSEDAFRFLQKLEPYLAPEYSETNFDTANELLIDDEVYLVSNWTYGIKVVVEDAGKEEIKAYRGWRGPEGEIHVLGGDVLAVPKGAPHSTKAVRLIELLISIETQKTLVARLRWPPVRLDAYDVSPEMAPYFQAVREALSYAEVRPTVPQWTLVEGVLNSAFEKLVREGKDIALLPEYSTALKNIPSRYLRYTVQTGDTLEAIARGNKTTEDELAVINCTTPGARVWPGQILLIPQQ